MRKSAKACFNAFRGLFTMLLIPAAAWAAEGEVAPDDSTEQTSSLWQTRFALGDGATKRPGLVATGLNPGNASLLGDYYFGRSLTGVPSPSGFRATSGLIFGPRALTSNASFTAMSSFAAGSFTLRDINDVATIPYLGFGYTGLKPRGGWRYDADFGLVAQGQGGLRQIHSPGLDDSVRDWHLAPLLQLGVSYSY